MPEKNPILIREQVAFKRLAGKAVEALTAILGSVAGAILSFLGKAVGFVAEHTWALFLLLQDLLVGG